MGTTAWWKSFWPWANPHVERRASSPSHRILSILMQTSPDGGLVDITQLIRSPSSELSSIGHALNDLDESGDAEVEVSYEEAPGWHSGIVGDKKRTILTSGFNAAFNHPLAQSNQRRIIKFSPDVLHVSARIRPQGAQRFFESITEDTRDTLDLFIPFIAKLTVISIALAILSLLVALWPRRSQVEIMNWPAAMTARDTVAVPPRTEGIQVASPDPVVVYLYCDAAATKQEGVLPRKSGTIVWCSECPCDTFCYPLGAGVWSLPMSRR